MELKTTIITSVTAESLHHRVAVIMAGGSGERFWPLSRRLRPKQLLRLTDPDRTMLQEAVDRIAPLVGLENVFIATATHLADPIREANIVPDANVFAEPDKRNTLGCLTWVAAHFLASDNRNVSLAILTADHQIENEDRFRSDIEKAFALTESNGSLVTIGIPPTRPETGYGYIECDQADTHQVASVIRFREKPDLETAKQFVESGRFMWNSGMFVWTLDAFLQQLSHAHAAAAEITHQMADKIKANEMSSATESFCQLPNLSIDYALMENATKVDCVHASFEWDDVGAFDALIRTMPKDADGNVILGDVRAIDCRDCVLYNESESQVLTAVGLQSQIFVQTQDASICLSLDDAQRVKEVVGLLKGTSYL